MAKFSREFKFAFNEMLNSKAKRAKILRVEFKIKFLKFKMSEIFMRI